MGNEKSRDHMTNKEDSIDSKRKRQIYIFAGLTFITIYSIHFFLVLSRWLDNDIYFYLGLGKYIWINKIVPDYHPYFIGGQIDNMIPQWLYDVAVYLINETAGYTGLFFFMLFWEFLGAFFLYKIARLKKVDGIASIILILMMFYMDSGVVTIRTNLMTLTLAIIQIYLLEKYKEDNRIRYLIPLPFISVLEMNAHMALWLIHLCIMAAYICPQIKLPIEIDKHKYKIVPLICTTLLMCAAGILNPYGVKAFFFVKDGVSDATLSIIKEMQPLAILSGEGLGIIVCSVALLCAIFKKKTSYEYFYLFLGLVFLGVNQSRNMYWGFLGIIILAFDMIKEKDFMTYYSRFMPRKLVGYWPFLIFFMIVALRVNVYGEGINCNISYEKAMDKMLDIIENDPSHTPNIFNDMEIGNYLEYKGYNIYLDTRMDGSMPGFTGGLDILSDYIALTYYASEEDYERILNGYEFRYAIVDSTSRLCLYMEMSDDYQLVSSEPCNNVPEGLPKDISLYKKVR